MRRFFSKAGREREFILYLLLPASSRAPHPTVICVPGHGRGVDDIVGIDENGKDRTGKPGYQHDFAIQAVEHGLAAVAIEPMAFGHRRDPITIAKGPGLSLSTSSRIGFADGPNDDWLARMDVDAAIDWIETRPDLDAQRVGVYGNFGGGTCTQFSSALDTAHQSGFRERLSEHIPRQYHERLALHRQLRSRDS